MTENYRNQTQRYVFKFYDKTNPMNEEQKQQFLTTLAQVQSKFLPYNKVLKISYQEVYDQYYQKVYIDSDKFIFLTAEDLQNNNKIIGGGLVADCTNLMRTPEEKMEKLSYSRFVKEKIEQELLSTYYDIDNQNRVLGDQSFIFGGFCSVQNQKIAKICMSALFLEQIRRGFQSILTTTQNLITENIVLQYNPYKFQHLDVRDRVFFGQQPFKRVRDNYLILQFDLQDLQTRSIICQKFLENQSYLFLENYEKDYKALVESILLEQQLYNNVQQMQPKL